jgi:hypothetical protein
MPSLENEVSPTCMVDVIEEEATSIIPQIDVRVVNDGVGSPNLCKLIELCSGNGRERW